MNGLDKLSREDLIALVLEMGQELALLRQEVEMLRSQLRGPGPDNGLPPFVKPNRPKRPREEGKPRKKREQAFTRKREEPTEEILHAVECCPDCGRKLEGGWEHSRHQVIELPAAPIRIIDHVLLRRRCGICQKEFLPRLGPAEGVLGQCRVGPRLMSQVAGLVTDYRLPRGGVQRLLESHYGLHLARGEVTGILHRVADRGRDAVDALLREVRNAPFVHADETGWREDGINGYLWSFSTPTVRYFYRDQSRGGKIARGVLLGQWEQADGSLVQEECEPFRGVLICDFYSGYSWYDGPIQRCWDHLCRELKDLKKEHAANASVVAWVDSVFKVYAKAKEVAARNHREEERRAWRRRLEAELREIARPHLADEAAPQQTLAARIERFQSELFVFVQYSGVPSGNNPAERALRPTVIARKVSGGTRSAKGSDTMAALRTLFGTWTLRGIDTLQACFDLLIGTPPVARAAPT